jgi:hypothetical protein
MSYVVYRVAGHLSPRSLMFIRDLRAAGDDPAIIDNLEDDLPLFESLCIGSSWEYAIDAFKNPVPEKYDQYLIDLERHIKSICRAEQLEALMSMIKGNDSALSLAAEKQMRKFK